MGTTSKVLACLLACLLAAESRMRGDLHVRFGGQGDLDPYDYRCVYWNKDF